MECERYGIGLGAVIPIPEYLYEALKQEGLRDEAIFQWWYSINVVFVRNS